MDPSTKARYEVVVGLEVHAQLMTASKIYAPDATHFGETPNTHVSVISLAHPGTLPRLNKKVVEMAIKMGLACGSEISRKQIFDRKNYFYPDLPKGYQLTQDRTPICIGGSLKVDDGKGAKRSIPLNRVHIEEDAGKSVHTEGQSDTLVDLNRAGVALIEIVTEPALRSSVEAGSFLTEVRRLVRYLEICDGNMEEGSLRCDANVSVRLKGTEKLGKKVEVKNLNSIKNVQKAIDFEVERQINLLEKQGLIISETRLFSADTGKTYGMREKEEMNDYRYFPDPDLSPLHISEEWLDDIKATLPELPWQLLERLMKQYKLSAYDAGVLMEDRNLVHLFEQVCQHTDQYKAVSNWIMGPVKAQFNESGTVAISYKQLAGMINMISAGKLSFTTASQRLFPALSKNANAKPEILARELNLIQDNNDSLIADLVDAVIKDFPEKVEEYRSSKKAKGLISMFMGELMKRSKGKADPKKANELLLNRLG
ncbi:Asp-tRNA(Asn)/Glu-tRNA(Gln) amidotransferase subunit GatB [Fulvivirga sp. M361]|uniref:Asp-tRNA(Asn)/Glu-tRNA(Gln) amidotransferase subunit GatB n=1 Tax=Fulvivirga sp. M361 TaxID=2594266 RepID=UPI00117AFB50|nr:Asp-tRNA(Asn)/Glu-tRNA(Gln) amidotransferase subunit GatB [Fulvivirga sp. M361]TRX52422.1 Asp-tRNA(Asn)/Glu-tRNA(Gln) amidotransferase subunit GatB [Fulvivirga sp. M361]